MSNMNDLDIGELVSSEKKRKSIPEEDSNTTRNEDLQTQANMLNLSTLERRKLKKKRKLLLTGKNIMLSNEEFHSIYSGINSSANYELKLANTLNNGKKQLKLQEITQLILWIFNTNKIEAEPVKWVFIKNKPLINNIILLQVDKFIMKNYASSYQRNLTFLSDKAAYNFSDLIPVQLTQRFALQEFLTIHSINKNKGKNNNNDNSSAETGPKPAAIDYILTLDELTANNYPVDSSTESDFIYSCDCSKSEKEQNDNNFPCLHSLNLASKLSNPQLAKTLAQRTKNAQFSFNFEEEVKKDKEYILYGLDCEMCITVEGFECCRCTVVDSQHRIVFDRLCKPYNAIIDYNTKYSGITEGMLKDCTLRLADIQYELLSIINSDNTILVGHSLENDLRALKIIHLKVIDTAILFPRSSINNLSIGAASFTYKSSLKYLAKKFLNRSIQLSEDLGSEILGHNSSEDAIAALELAQLKIIKGASFGLNSAQSMEEISLFEKLFQNIEAHNQDKGSLPIALKQFFCSNSNQLANNFKSFIAKNSNVQLSLQPLQSANDFSLLKAFAKQIQASQAISHNNSNHSVLTQRNLFYCHLNNFALLNSGNLSSVLENFVSEFAGVYSAAAKNSAFIFISGQNNCNDNLGNKKNDAIESAKQHQSDYEGAAFISIKQ
jgi:DNA polymerase III epsilon subunit-like protein